MTIGRSAYCRLVAEDERTVIYEYACSNWCYGDYQKDIKTFDGIIMIDKSCFVKAELREKIRRNHSGRKVTVVKKIIQDVDVSSLIHEGKIYVKNCKACKDFVRGNIGFLALMLLWELFRKYQEIEEVPQECGVIQ